MTEAPGATAASAGVVVLSQVIVRATESQTPPLLIGSTGSVPAGSVSTTTRSWAVETLEELALEAFTLNVTTWPGETRAGLASSVLAIATLGSTIVVLTVELCVTVRFSSSLKVRVAVLGRLVPRVLALTSSTLALKCSTSTTSWPVVLAYVAGNVAVTVLAGDSATVTPAAVTLTPSSVQAVAHRLPGTSVWRAPSGSTTVGVPYRVVPLGIVVVTV